MIHEWPNKDDPAVRMSKRSIESTGITEFINDHRPSELKTLLRGLLVPGPPCGRGGMPWAGGWRPRSAT